MRADANYRPDIDGLRAIAVGVVVLFHARLGLFPGGYTGVDVFFVISGYLITSIICRERDAGTFSFAGFYERRIRRIFPALAVVLIAALVAGALLMTPRDYLLLGRSARSTAAFYSNFYFLDQSGYFMPAAETMPLLHTWSLAVEEQFYLIAPLFLVLLAKAPPRVQAPIVWSLFFISLALSAFGAFNTDPSAFYLLHTRAFELMTGAILALGLVPTFRNQRLREVAGLVGVLFIALAALSYSDRTPFPGLAALMPCVGAALVISSGIGGTTAVSRSLSTGHLVFTGKISYSLYLWHWPILIFAGLEFGSDITVWHRLGLIALAILLSALTYKFVEQPARRRTGRSRRGMVIASGLSGMAAIAIVSHAIISSGGWPERMPSTVRDIEARVAASIPPRICPKSEGSVGTREDCVIGAKSMSSNDFLLWGDSHAAMIAQVLSAAAAGKSLHGRVLTHGNCAPFLSSPQGNGLFNTPNCPDIKVRVEEILKTQSYPHLILAARWAIYAEGTSVRNDRLVGNSFDTGEPQENRSEFLRLFNATIERLARSGRMVTIIGPVPELPLQLSHAMSRAMMRGKRMEFAMSAAAFYQREATVLAALKAAERIKNVRVLYPHTQLCDASTCKSVSKGIPLYWDDNHLGSEGIAVIAPVLQQAFGVATNGGDERRQ